MPRLGMTALFVLLCGPTARATVTATTAAMVGSSDIVVEGKIERVQPAGKGLRRMTIAVTRVLHSRWIVADRGDAIDTVKRLAFTYRRPAKGQLDIDERPGAKPRLFFLYYAPDRMDGAVRAFHLELGNVLDATAALRKEVEAVSMAARRIYEKQR